MTKDEALKLALEALEFIPESGSMLGAHAEGKRVKAITAIKQARALDKKAENARELGLDYEPVREPVAMYRNKCADGSRCLHGCHANEPCYTTPPAAQRQWVGLTDEEMYLNCPNWLSQEQCKVWIQQIEAKLRSKNNG